MKKSILISFALLLLFSSCEKILLHPKPETDNKAIFEEYSTLVKEKYAMLEFKGVDINHLIDSISPLVTESNTEKELFDHLALITKKLRDGHSSLDAYKGLEEFYQAFDINANYPAGFHKEILYSNYLVESANPNMLTIPSGTDLSAIDETNPEPRVIYGKLAQDENIGYFRIASFGVEISDSELETIFGYLKNTDGMILDVRNNGGGDPALSTKIASYFISTSIYTGYERFKIGPAAGDFADSQSNITPISSNNNYLKPVVVLTDRGCFSATTTLCYNMNPLEYVTFMGQRTGGGSGSVADGFLANGWKWSLSTSEFIDHEGRHLDDGIDPDITVALDTLDTMHDEVLDAAIEYLQ